MFGRKINPIILIVIALAIFGFGLTMFRNPGSLFMNLLISAGIIALFSVILYFFLLKPKGSNSRSYQKAVKQSKKKYGKKTNNMRKLKSNSLKSSKSPGRAKLKRKADHLRVIDGKKGKKKDRASF